MQRFLLKIRFDGSEYCGWQVQPNGITVQEKMCAALSQLLNEKVDVTGCSRTDSGVHANEFCCHFSTQNNRIDEKGYIGALNALLPQDISVFYCEKATPDFHARYSAKSKEYVYKIYKSDVRNPFLDKYALRVYKTPDFELINKFCKSVVGTHDFYGFSASGRTASTTVRTVYEFDFYEKDGIYEFRIVGNGFLYNMVRILVGSALDISDGRKSLEEVLEVFDNKERSCAGKTAPPFGLYLNKVNY